LPPERLILGFDTSAAHCAAALLCGDTVLAAREEPMEKGQAERLMSLLEDVLHAGGVGWRDLALLAVGVGPGNFTGVRIAVAAARGLALGLAVPAIGVTRFAALAHGLPRPLVVAENTRRGETYLQEFGLAGQTSDARIAAPPLLASGMAPTYLVGNAAETFAAMLDRPVTILYPRFPVAEAIAREAAQLLGTPQPRPAPFYLRGADASPPSDPPPVILDAVQ